MKAVGYSLINQLDTHLTLIRTRFSRSLGRVFSEESDAETPKKRGASIRNPGCPRLFGQGFGYAASLALISFARAAPRSTFNGTNTTIARRKKSPVAQIARRWSFPVTQVIIP